MNETVRLSALDAVDRAPNGYAVRIEPKDRTKEQNAKLHAELGEIAKSTPWAGQLRDTETWKRLIVAAWLRERGEPIELLPALDGHGVDVVFRHTSKMTIKEVAELIEYVQAWKSLNITRAA